MDTKNVKLTKRELELMQIVWDVDHPVLATDILKIYENKELKISIYLIHNLLRSLLDKNLIFVSGYELVGKTHTRKYEAAISEREYELLRAGKFFEENKNLGASSLMAALLDTDENEASTISELEKMLAERKKQLKDKG